MCTALVLRVAELWEHTTAGKMDIMTAHSALNHALHLLHVYCLIKLVNPPASGLYSAQCWELIRRPWKIHLSNVQHL